jgi:tetratricopeptide (TPR) repeat protein
VKRAILLLLLCMFAGRPVHAAPKWARVDTPNFIIIGAVGESDLRAVGKQFEGFREALGKLLSNAATATPVPTVVIVFPDEKTFDPFKPIYEGKPVRIAGLFLPHPDVNYILLGPNRGLENLRPVFHEYAHLVISNVAPRLPVWLNEGLAEYYSTFDMDPRGKSVVFGRIIQEHYYEMGSYRLMPLETLLATEHDSPEYNERNRQSLFYAECWLLVHLLFHGEPDRRQAFADYTREVAGGTPAIAAWQHQFGNQDMYKALHQYLQRRYVRIREYKLSDRILQTPGTAVAIAPADVEATLGELLLALGRREPAKTHFDRALAVQPSSTRAAVGKARATETKPALSATPDPSADWFADYMLATALLRQSGEDRAALDAARAALARAAAARPDVPNVQVLFAMANERTDGDPAAAVAALKKAVEAAPVRDDYAVYLARAMARAGEFAAARALLGRIMARPLQSYGGEMARAAMKQIVIAEGYASRGENPAAALPADRPNAEAESPATPSVERPVYRKLGDGEQRTEGLLERIECVPQPRHIEFVVKGADREYRFQASSFDGIELISYRADLQGSISCGDRTPFDRVYVTWRTGGQDGAVVAIEFLPKQ